MDELGATLMASGAVHSNLEGAATTEGTIISPKRQRGARLRRKATVRTAVEMGRLARPHSANASPRGLTFTQ